MRNSAYRLWRAYRLRWKRRYFLARAIRRRRQLSEVRNQTDAIRSGSILAFSTVRNEQDRIAYFLQYHRNLGVDHFLIVDNASTDGTREYLAEQNDVSLWTSDRSYKLARFGVDWLTWLQFRYGHSHWCLTLDADELFLPPHADTRTLKDLCKWLDDAGLESAHATMVDLYPKGPLGTQAFEDGADPLDILQWFDADGYFSVPRDELRSRILRGGVRHRVFFGAEPDRAPTLNKVPLVRWNRRFAYVTSTHVILPAYLNATEDKAAPTAAILHTKFLPKVTARAAEEKYRAEHFSNSTLYDAYYDALVEQPDLWTPASARFEGWNQLEALGLMRRGGWD